MFYQVTALALCSFLLIFSAVRKLSIFSPPVITSAVWFIVFSAGFIFNERFFPLAEEAFIAWLIWFSIVGIVSFLFAPSEIYRPEERFIRVLPFDYFYLLLGLVVWIWYRIWVVGSSGPEHFFLNLRLSSNGLEGFEPLGTVGRFYPLIFALFTFEHIYTHKRNRHLRIICWIWMMSYAIATMGKFAVLTPILAWSIIKGLQGRIRMGRIAAIVCGTFVLMLVVHFIRKGEQDEAGFLDVLATYVYSPIVALGYVKPVVPEYTAPYVFRFFYAMGNFFGLSPAPIDVISDYVYIPFPTNVYTVMQPFLHDFSLIGVAVGALFYAFLFCILFWLAVMNKGYYLGLYAMISICLVGQFFAETLLMMLSQHIQEAIMLAFIFIVSRRRFDVG